MTRRFETMVPGRVATGRSQRGVRKIETLLGYKVVDFIDDGGKPVKGVNLFTSFPDDEVIGEACGKLFIREGFDLPSLTPGMQLEVVYNRKGRPVSIAAAGN